ncbi:MAG: cytochrome c3 family protein [Holophaga sp.]|nr:cytochrome c3 family protein [Holophaga sp.]
MPRAWWNPWALAATLALCLFPASGLAREPGALTYRGGGQGKVVFDHQLHASRGYSCHDCHVLYKPTGKQLFQTQKQGRITLADHDGTTLCFACHNDTIAFAECGKCHRS